MLAPEVVQTYYNTIDRDLEAIDLHLSASKFLHYAVFHCQQCVEKILKLLLAHAEIDYPHTHDLERLVKSLPSHHPFKTAFEHFVPWSQFAVTPRYDFEIDIGPSLPSRDEVKEWRKSLDDLYKNVQEFVEKCLA